VDKSRLQLNHYSIVRLHIDPTGEIEPLPLGQYADFSDAHFKSQVSFNSVKLPNGEPRTTVQLKLEAEPKLEKPFPYRFTIEMVGVFDGRELPEERRDALTAANGASLLYGAAREILLSLSMRNMMGALMLPSVSFESVGRRIEASRTENSEKASK
jgi:preprotein translocase subunit SecB